MITSKVGRTHFRRGWKLSANVVLMRNAGAAGNFIKRTRIWFQPLRPLLFLFLLGLSQSHGATAIHEDWPLACLGGTVRDTQGKPISGATVQIMGTGGLGDGYQMLWYDRPTDNLGRYLLGYARRSPGRAFIFGLRAEAPGFVRFDQKFITATPRAAEQQPKDGFLHEFVTADGTIQFTTLFVSNQLVLLKGSLPPETPVLSPNQTNTFDIVLSRGELLSGKVVVPNVFPYDDPEIKPSERTFSFQVTGPGFDKVYSTSRGGDFKVWVPHGIYTLDLSDFNPPVRLENVRSPSENLRLVKVDPPLLRVQAANAFDALWADMNTNYSYSGIKHVDWERLRRVYRPQALKCSGSGAFCNVLLGMLTELHDGHVWLECKGSHGYTGFRPKERVENYNPEIVEAALEDVKYCGNFALVGKVKHEGFGAFVMLKQSAAEDAGVQQAVQEINALSDMPGFIIDLRNANGGDELLARKIASQFCAKDTVYAKSKYRAGPRPNDFGEVFERVLSASKTPFTKPVVCLLGFRCVSSGEGFAQMMSCLPNVTTIGQPTRGSSGNPRPFEIPDIGITVYYSRWVDMMPDGTPIEDAGVRPAVTLNFPQEAYKQSDPTWAAAVKLLHEKITNVAKPRRQ